MTSQPPQEKKCICIAIIGPEKKPFFAGHYHDCPLYTPPAQEEKKHEEIHYACKDRISVGNKNIFGKEKLFVGCCICTKHNCQPPQPKEHLAQEEKVYFAPTPTAATESFLFDLFLKYEPKEPEMWEDCTHLCHNEKNVVCLYCLSQDCDLIPIVSKICNYFVVAGVKIKKEDVDFVKRQLVTARLSAAAEERKRVCEEIKREIDKLPIPYFEKWKTDDTFDEYVARSKGNVQALSDVLSILNKYCE